MEVFFAFAPVAQWISDSFPIIRIVLIIIEVLLSMFLISVVLFQAGDSTGLGQISGGYETFFGKHKGSSFEGRLKRITVFTAISLVVIAIIYFITMIIYNG